MAKGDDRLAFLDALRGLAALYVLVVHVGNEASKRDFGLPSVLDRIVRAGGTGVTLFFVASAFTLCYTLQARQGEPHAVTRFYLRRLFRIAPLYFAWLFVMVVLKWGGHGLYSHPYDILSYATFSFNFSPSRYNGIVLASWTLGVEMIFYLLFPLIFRFTTSVRSAMVFVGLSLAAAYAYSAYVYNVAWPGGFNRAHYLSHNLFIQLPVFAIGIVTYWVFEKFRRSKEIPPSRGVLLSLASAVIFAGMIYVDRDRFPNLRIYGFAIVYSLLILGLSIRPLPAIVNRVSIWYGMLCYSVYLNHPNVILWFSSAYHRIYGSGVPSGLKLAACCMLTLIPLTALSWMTYLVIEQPFIRMGSSLIKRIGRPIVAVQVPHEELANASQ